MIVSGLLLKCIAKAFIQHVGDLAIFPVGSIAVDAWERWEKQTNEGQRRAEIQAVAQQDNLRELVAQIVREEAAALPAPQQKKLAGYLNQIPSTIRQSLRRPSDPTGKTVSPGLSLRKAEDLVGFLPQGCSRFQPGQRFQPRPGVAWELVEPLGVGGFGEVWKARDLPTRNVTVALKFCLDPQAKNQLLRHEAAILKQVVERGGHKGIVRLLDQYLEVDPPCLAYEFVEGGTLVAQINEWRLRKGGLSPRDTAKVVRQLAEIIGFAHSLQPPIVHRDLKPANVLVVDRGKGKYVLKITDFGIGGVAAKQAINQTRVTTRRQDVLPTLLAGSHTPLYASPQQTRGDGPDPRDDVFALGVIWYQLLMGDVTVSRPGGNAWQKQLVAERSMPAPLLELLVSCFEEERKDRPQHAGLLAAQLATCLGGTDEAIPWAVPVAQAPLVPSVAGDGHAKQPQQPKPALPSWIPTIVGDESVWVFGDQQPKPALPSWIPPQPQVPQPSPVSPDSPGYYSGHGVTYEPLPGQALNDPSAAGYVRSPDAPEAGETPALRPSSIPREPQRRPVSSQPPSQPPPQPNNKVLWIVLGAVFGSFALCGFCAIGGLVVISFFGQVTNKTFSSVAPAIQSTRPPSSARTTADSFVSHLSAGQEVQAWQDLSGPKQTDLTVAEFTRQVAAWPRAADQMGFVDLLDTSSPGEKKTFTATVKDRTGTTHRLELEVVSEFGEWKIDSFKLK